MKIILASIILVLGLAAGVWAQGTTQSNVDLSTVPSRDTVQLTIYNSEDLTLVRETRKVSFKKGVNPLQFSWANTLIDPTSVRLRFVTHPEKLELLDTTFPHSKPQMLYWNIQSEMDGEATVEITYFTSGISWSADYLCIANPDETEMGFEGFVRVFNNSGEEYENAQVRLVVGKINLVEKIAQLAQITDPKVPKLEEDRTGRHSEAKQAMALIVRQSGTQCEQPAARAAQAQGNHQGGPERILHLHHRRHGDDPQRLVETDAELRGPDGSLQGPVSLPGAGIRRSTRPHVSPDQRQGIEAGDDAAAGWDGAGLPPERSGRALVPGGPADQVRPDWRQDRVEPGTGPRGDLRVGEARRPGGTTSGCRSREPTCSSGWTNPACEIEVNSSVVGWDDHTLFAQRIRNYTKKPIDVEIRRTLPGHIVFRSSLGAKNFDYQTVEYHATVKPMEKASLPYEVLQHQGRNAKQNSVTVEAVPVQ